MYHEPGVWYSHLNTDEGRDLASTSVKQVPPTAALLHHEHLPSDPVVVMQVFSDVTVSQVEAFRAAFWYSHWNTEEGRDLASDSTQQVPPTAALLHHEHFSAPDVEVMQVFSEVTLSQVVVFKAVFWNSHWNTDDGRDLASDSTKQVPPTAALLHQEHFSVEDEDDMQVLSLLTVSQVTESP